MDQGFHLFPDQASTMAGKVDALFAFMCAVTAFFTLLIFVLVLGFAIKYRRRSEEPPPEQPSYRSLELAWSVIPLAICMVMFGWGAWVAVGQSRIPDDAMEIRVLGKQWMWKLQHPDGRREINTLTVPVGQPIKLVMTSQDVIHSFFVPAFRTKQDVLPGRYSYMWFEPNKPGTYHLFCAEYCGQGHSSMIGEVHVLTPAQYTRWLEANPPEEEPAAVTGFKLFNEHSCNTCHSSLGPSLAGLFGRANRPVLENGEPAVIAKVDESYLRESILYPRAKIAVRGDGTPYPADLMPTYAGQLTEEQVAALIAYIRSVSGTVPTGTGTGVQQPGVKMQELAPPPPKLDNSVARPGAQ